MKVDINDPYAVADHDTVMRKKGYIVGYYGSVNADKLVTEIKTNLGKNLQKANGMFVTYYMNENSSLAMFFGDSEGEIIMKEIEALCNKNADTIFEIQYDNSLALDVFEYEILLSGIDQPDKEGILK